MTGVLQDLKVLDLSWGIAGPMATMLLADHGAQVTKIEPPGGDPFRFQSGYRAWNRGKRSAVLDLKRAGDREVFLALAGTADIVVESFESGVAEKLGVDYETLRAINPRLIYCSISAYGRHSRHAGRPGYDSLVAARTGLMWDQRGWPEGAVYHMARRPDPFADLEVPYDYVQGPPRQGPIFPATHWPSLGAFYAAATAISAALYVREATGRGQHVETSLMQGAMACASGVWQRAEDPDAPGYNTWILGSKSPKGHFQCADGRWVQNWVPNPRFVMTASEGDTLDSNPDLTVQNDPDRFGLGPEELFVMMHYQPLMAERFARFTAQEWTDAAAVAGMTLQPIRSPEEALTDPHFLDDGCVAEIDDPELGRIRQVGITYSLETSRGKIQGPSPRVGEHTEQVKKEAESAKERAAPDMPDPAPRRAPLEGVLVVDLGLAIAGPYGTQLLSDLGARVIKINTLYDMYWHGNHIAHMANRGKESLALNLKEPQAMEILLKLVEKADVVQHNMRYAAAERLGIDYESLKKINPRLVYCHTRGFERGPRDGLPGNDQTGACLTGVQYEDGGMARGGKPIWTLTSLGDTGNGFLSAIGIVQALYEREKTGRGQMVDTSIVNAHMLNASYAVAAPDGTPLDRPRTDGMQFGFHALNRLYQCADGWLCLTLVFDEHWDRLCVALGEEALEIDQRFADPASRRANDEALSEKLSAVFSRRSARDCFDTLDRAGVPCEICDPDFALTLHDDPEMVKHGYTVSFDDTPMGRLDQTGLLFHFSETPGVVQGPPVIVGKESSAILRELGYSDAQIGEFCEKGFVLQHKSEN